MSRYAGYIRALATGYGLLLVNIAYSMAMIPLALAHLGKETFGLWALTMQIGAIVQLADAGMTGALNRILMEYKDDKSSASYRQTFYTMWLVFVVLGVGVAVAVGYLAPLLAGWLEIPANLRESFIPFLAAYGLVLGVMFATKPLPMLPFVHQRSDLLNSISAISLILGFLILWAGLEAGWGLWSLLAGLACGQVLTVAAVTRICFSKRYFPRPSQHPSLSRVAFLEVFDYGKDRMLITIGFTTLQATPTFLITRLLGLEANAVWAVVTRMNQLCLQMISKVSDLSYPVLAEMHVRGEHDLMRRRYSHLLVVSFGVASLCAVGIATSNGDFVSLWTGGRIRSNALLDSLLALWLLTLVLQKFLFVPASIARNIRDVRFFYIIETALVAILGLLLLKAQENIWHMAAVMSAASLAITIPRNLWKSSNVLQSNWSVIVGPIGLIALRVLLPAMALMIGAAMLPAAHQWWTLAIKVFTAALCSTCLLATLPELRHVLLEVGRRFSLPLLCRKTA